MLTAEMLRSVIHYDAETGIFIWKIQPCSRRPIGSVAGGVTGTNARNPQGYWVIAVAKKHYRAHRLAWLYTYGESPAGEIDHINGDHLDNRICNLRVANRQQQCANSVRPSHNSSGFKGVSRKRNKWRARVKVNQKEIGLGVFNTKEEAHAAYMKAAQEHFGEFACDGRRD